MTTMQRRHDIDALRVIAFGLLILYHSGMFYVADWGWHIKSVYTSEWLQEPMRFLNQWRMSLLFVISGLAMSFVRRRYTGGRLALRRLWRLGLPLIFGMAVIVAPQPYFEALGKGIIEPGYWAFWGQYLTFQDFPGNAWGGENEIVWTWNHLWYLPYVLFYTLLAIPLGLVLDKIGVNRLLRNLRGWAVVAVPVIPLMLYGNFVFPHYPFIDHSLLGDTYAHCLYGTLFFYGYLIGNHLPWWDALAKHRRGLLITGLVAYISLRTQEWWVPENASGIIEQLSFLSVYVNRWTWILVLFAYGYRYLNRPSDKLRYATDAIFPWYILHQTITVALGGTLGSLALGPVIEPLLVVGGTVLGCYVIYEFFIRRIPVLRPLFGLPWKARQSTAAHRVTASTQ
ncbi:MAG: acyltransferase family protein [Pseudomonadota bacterium]